MTADILRIAVPSPLFRYFDYLAPQGVDVTQLQPGIRLRVPFGNSRKIGILTEVCKESPLPREQLRRVLTVLDRVPLLSQELIALLDWAQRYYHHPPGEVFSTALPTLLRRGKAADIDIEPLWCITEQGRNALHDRLMQRAPRQRNLLELLAQHPTGLGSEQLRRDIDGWSESARKLLAKGFLSKQSAPPSGPPRQSLTRPLALNPAQSAAVDTVCVGLDQFQTFLLDGVTGSGKTEVYLQIVAAVLEQGRQALVLVPEIGLTPQLIQRFQRRLPCMQALLHSGLNDRERLNAWLQAGSGDAGVIIGTRSAIFTPLKNPGIIILDEEHDGSFKQQDGFRYNARDLAIVRARRLEIPVLLGSATPSLESLHNVQRDRYQCLRLPERVGAALAPKIALLDMRRQKLEEGGLSAPLLKRMEDHLEQGNQVLLFLNRRGFAPTLICHECGWVGQCRQCDAHLTVHLRRHRLICHFCGAEQALQAACPGCGSIDLRALGQGTERIETTLEKRFPDVGIARIDRDSTRRKGSLQQMLQEIRQGRRRILIGTQMLAKGHHFPDVTLVGIVDADQGLFGADYRASERMAQQILQVAGRAGRADKPGLVLIQTHHPGHPLLQTLIRKGYAAFAAIALNERLNTGLPPFSCQALLRAEADQAEPAQVFLREAAALASDSTCEVDLLGPAPAPMERRAGRYRAQLLLQTAERRVLHRLLDPWVEQLSGLKSGRKVRWSLDVDPLDLL
jgi:primosomal protein N' (replication factor Y)